jgi:hypothetical protein
MKSITKAEKKLFDVETRAEEEVTMAGAAVGVDVGADADQDDEVEGGDAVEEHVEVELGAEFESGASVANTEDESAAELVVVVKVDVWLGGS